MTVFCLLALVLAIGQILAQEGNGIVGAGPEIRPLVKETAVSPNTNNTPPQIQESLPPVAYLPFIATPSCLINSQAEEIAQFAISDPAQDRPEMICDPILAQVAYEKALDMGTRNYFGHTNPDGYGANYLVQQAGYDLPDWYDQSPSGNNIESLAAGYTTAQAAWDGWMNSPGHRTHILGLEPFWASQTYYGIGYAYMPGSDFGHYWVFITAPPQN